MHVRVALARDEGYYRAHLRRATALLHLRRPLDARQAYQRALSLSPSCAAAQVGERYTARAHHAASSS